jgi:hypothetical protein
MEPEVSLQGFADLATRRFADKGESYPHFSVIFQMDFNMDLPSGTLEKQGKSS